ncbi:MAG: PepSY-associated TM helix domain-containing protein [Bacteroidales bacterium]|nr:PepSY-associated TM helix domain-containing protein [Bacteroidales bacterium]
MKMLRKWSRILHRDIGFFFIGTTLIYGLSGIALNHLNDWNPNYSVEVMDFQTQISLEKNAAIQKHILELLGEIAPKDTYKQHYYPQSNQIKIFLSGGSSVLVNLETGKGQAEFLKKRPVFYESNYLHYNPNSWWKWFSDIYAGALILFAITSFFMVRGKNGIWGWGGIYTLLGILIPLLFLFFLLK